jgi:Fe-S-cluster containining protein
LSLTAIERETIIVLNDEEDVAYISTSQRPWITTLKKNESATLVEEGKHDGTAFASFTIPKNMLTIRSKKRVAGVRKGGFKGAKCGFLKKDGNLCEAVASKETGRCRFHADKP